MPNWTNNQITISGDKKSLKKFIKDAIKDENGEYHLSSWNQIPETFLKYDTTNHPNGEGLKVGKAWYDGLGYHDEIVTDELIEEFKKATKEQKEKYGVIGWYDYNCLTFGCKWDSEVQVKDSIDRENLITLITDTPWTTPNNWLISLSEKYPKLTFNNVAHYEEGFVEEYSYEEGVEKYVMEI